MKIFYRSIKLDVNHRNETTPISRIQHLNPEDLHIQMPINVKQMKDNKKILLNTMKHHSKRPIPLCVNFALIFYAVHIVYKLWTFYIYIVNLYTDLTNV
jgi:hypothetical protein